MFALPWLHENATKMDLSMKINIQHLLQVILEKKRQKKSTACSLTKLNFILTTYFFALQKEKEKKFNHYLECVQ